jgi:hypothetical protein
MVLGASLHVNFHLSRNVIELEHKIVGANLNALGSQK